MPTDPLRNSLVDQVTTQDLNFHQRRITNAHPSIDDFDYVVRKELRKFQDDLLKKVSALGESGTATEMHVFGVSGQVSVGTDIFPPMIFAHDVRLKSILTTFKDPPIGCDFIADIRGRSSGNTILSEPLMVHEATYNVTEYNPPGVILFKYDVIIADILQVGSTIPGNMWTAYMLFEVIGD